MTLRELCWMAEGRQRDEWNRASSLLTALCEPYRDRKEHPRPYSPSEFNPFSQSTQAVKEDRFEVSDWNIVRKAWGL